MNFKFDIDLLKAEQTDEGLFLSGVASTTGTDKQNEAMSPNALKSMVETEGIIPIVTSHNAEAKDVIGEVVSHSIDDQGRYVIKARLEEDSDDATRMFKLVQKGHKMGFSVGGRVLSASPGLNKSVKRVIDRVELDHIMLTRRPVNPQTFATAITKALDAFEEPMTTEQLSKAGAKFSADTLSALKDIHDAGDDNVKAKIAALLGDDAGILAADINASADADAGDSSDDASASTEPEADAPANADTPMGAEGANVDDNDADDTQANDVGQAVNNPVADKSLSKEQLDLIKAEITKTIKAELAKAVKPEPKVSEPLAKAVPFNPSHSLSEAIRLSISG